MTVRYNKQDMPLSRQEAIIYAQKGMNYDKLQERLKETAAKLNEYERKAAAPSADSLYIDKQALVDSQLESFLRSNPGVDPRKLPQSVIGAWKRGVPLTEAYLAHKAQELSEKMREMETAAAQADNLRRHRQERPVRRGPRV